MITDEKTLQQGPTPVISNSSMVVPFHVLVAWLTHIHETTGRWPMPPAQNSIHPPSINATTVPAPPEAANQTGHYQERLPGMLPYTFVIKEEKAPPPEGKKARPTKTDRRQTHIYKRDEERFNYRESPFYKEAERLIGDSRRPDLSFHCKLVLALILAWCHFPLFKGEGGRTGQWMTLSALKCSREIKMQLKLFYKCVADLQGAELVEVGQMGVIDVIPADQFAQLRYDLSFENPALGVGEKGFWSERSIQPKKSWVYKLKVTPGDSLPVFNPFVSRNDTGTIQESPGITAERYRNHRESLIAVESDQNEVGERYGNHVNVVPGDSRSSFDPTCMNDSINECMHAGEQGETKKADKEEDGTKIHIPSAKSPIEEQLDRVIATLTPRQKAKLDFLSNAGFQGYQTDKGQTNLDRGECVKFAIEDKLTLETIQTTYFELVEKWERGEVKKNPLGWLHRRLTQVINPRKAKEKEGVDYHDERSEGHVPGRGRQQRRGAMGGNGAGKKQSRPAAQETTSEPPLFDENGKFIFR